MQKKVEEIRIDYHFHPNLPKNEVRAKLKIAAIYKKLVQLNITAVLITEHVYKDYIRAWQLMQRYKPDNLLIFPGLEYVTKENIDICLFSKTEDIYQHNFKPFQLTYEEIMSFLKVHTSIYSYVTHPFTLGRTSVIDKKGEEFAKAAINELGSVEASYTVFSELKDKLQKSFIKRLVTKILRRIEKNEHIPPEFHPKNVKFLAAGSDAHYVWEIGTYVKVLLKENDIFYSIVNNKQLHVIGSRQSNALQLIISSLTTLHEWWLKKWFKIRKISRRIILPANYR
jgi:hypothetical protein